MEAGHRQRQPDNDLQELCYGSHKCSPTHAKLFAASLAATANLHNCSALVGPTGRGFFPLLVIPDHANHCDEHGHDWPRGETSDQNEEEKLDKIMPACFRAEEFTAQFVKGRRLDGRSLRGRNPLCFRCRTIVVICQWKTLVTPP